MMTVETVGVRPNPPALMNKYISHWCGLIFSAMNTSNELARLAGSYGISIYNSVSFSNTSPKCISSVA